MPVLNRHRRIWNRTWQYGECYVCGRLVGEGHVRVLIDRNTGEVLDPSDEANHDRGPAVPVGSECLKRLKIPAAWHWPAR